MISVSVLIKLYRYTPLFIYLVTGQYAIFPAVLMVVGGMESIGRSTCSYVDDSFAFARIIAFSLNEMTVTMISAVVARPTRSKVTVKMQAVIATPLPLLEPNKISVETNSIHCRKARLNNLPPSH